MRFEDEENEDMSSFLMHTPCDNCGSSDGNSLYSDGHEYCFVCQHYKHADKGAAPLTQTNQRGSTMSDILRMSDTSGAFIALQARGITEETAKKYGYWVGRHNNTSYQIANYYDEDGSIVFQKLRDKDKNFLTRGKAKPTILFGKHLWNGGKKIIVTEGEIDCLSVAQVQGCKYPVVSVPLGAQGAKKAIAANYDYFEQFEQVIIMFDQDDAGRKAASECAEVLPQGKAFIAVLPMKDANECLLGGQTKAIIDAIWNASPFVPDGVVTARSLKERVKAKAEEESTLFPVCPILNEMTKGARAGEVVMLTSGSGMGKSTFARHCVYYWGKHLGEKIGNAFLEEAVEETCLDIMGLHSKIRLRQNPKMLNDQQKEALFDETFGVTEDEEWCYMYDCFAESREDLLLSKLHYMAKGLGCKKIILDHLSIVVSSMDEGGDERKTIDRLMTKLKAFAKGAGVVLVVITHLKRIDSKKGHEEGEQVSLSHLRGSGSIAQLSDTVIAFERDQQGEDPNKVTVRVLKCRFTGATGVADTLMFNTETGWLEETFNAHESTEF